MIILKGDTLTTFGPGEIYWWSIIVDSLELDDDINYSAWVETMGGKVYTNGLSSWAEFETEEDATAFKLKYMLRFGF